MNGKANEEWPMGKPVKGRVKGTADEETVGATI